jgi:hypothetical protein
MVFVPSAELLAGELRHLVHNLGVEKALFFGLCLVGPEH